MEDRRLKIENSIPTFGEDIKLGVKKMGQRFEDLEVFLHARALTKRIYEITREKPFHNDRPFIDQIRLASLSIQSNIAKGFERNSDAELIKFLGYSKGSCGEVRAQLYTAFDLNYLDEAVFQELISMCLSISKQISGFQKYLKGKKAKSHP